MIDCSYGQRNVRGPSKSQGEMSRLVSRVRELEAEKVTPSSSQGPQSSLHQRPHVSNAQQQAGLGAMMELGEDAHMTRNHEDSSAASFMNQLRATIEQQVSPEAPRPPSSAAPKSRLPRQGRRGATQQSFDYVLPPRKKADELLRIYWQLVDPLYPFLEKDDFDSTYQCLWTGAALECDEATLLCLLNTIFSLACALDASSPPEDRRALADTFFARANQFINLDLLQEESLLTVQCFLILGQYLQSTNEPQKCWTFVGLAIRTAQTLGLHLPSTSAHAQNNQETDLLRRVWHGCILLDRALSMTFGRPSMITTQAANSVPKPLPHIDIHACECTLGDSQSEQILQDRHFFIESLRLYEILNDILLSIYTPVSDEAETFDEDSIVLGKSSAAHLSAIFRIDEGMRLYVRQLPRHLKFGCLDRRTIMHERQTNVLWLRYHHIRILLLRNALTHTCVSPQNAFCSIDMVLPSRVALQCAILCVETSIRVVEFFSEKTKSGQSVDTVLDRILPAWWYNIFYIYTAATVLIAARLSTAITADVSNKRLTDTLEEAIRLLKMFSRYSKNADRCVAALRILLDNFPWRMDQSSRIQDQHIQSDQSQTVYPVDLPSMVSERNSSSATEFAAISLPADLEQLPDLDFALDWNDLSWLSSVPINLSYNC